MSEKSGHQITGVDDPSASSGQVPKTPLKDNLAEIQVDIPKGKLNPKSSVDELVELVCLLRERFQLMGNLEDIKHMIGCTKLAILLVSDHHLEHMKPMLLSGLAGSYLSRFLRSMKAIDLNRAISCWSQSLALRLAPESRSPEPAEFDTVGDLYQLRFRCEGVRADMDSAIQYFSRAASIAINSHDEKPDRLVKLVDLHKHRFKCLGELADIDKAIVHAGRAALVTPDSDTTKADYLGRLGNLHQTRFDRLGELVDIDDAVDCHQQAVLLTPDDHASKPSCLSNLGNSYTSRFMRLGTLVDIDRAIECQDQAVSLVPDGDKDKPAILDNLGISLQTRFQYLGNIEDTNKATECQAQAVQLTPDGDADKPGRLTNLGNSYMVRYMRLGELVDFEKAIDCHNQAVLLTPDGHVNKPMHLNNLGITYQNRFERLGMLVDVDKAIDCYSRAVLLIRDGYANKPALLNNLGNAHRSRFEYLGDLMDADKAIECHSQSVFFTPDDHASKPARLNNLGFSYRRRFKHLLEVADINRSIDCHNRAILLTPDGHSTKPAMLDNLGAAYQLRFARLGDISDIEKAIDHQGQAVLLTANGQTGKACMLSNLGSSYKYRFGRLRELADIDKAIDYQNQAVLLTPDGHTDKSGWLINLGGSFMHRFELSGEPADLDKAISWIGQAVSLIPDSYILKSQSLCHLGLAYKCRFEKLGDHSDLVNASIYFQRAAQSAIGLPQVRMTAAREWAKLSSLLHTSSQLAHQTAMELVPRLAWLGATVDQRYNLLVEIGDVAMDAAAWAISVNAYDLAVEWLEEGRSVVWNQLLKLRSTFYDLATVHPTLAKQLEDVGRQLEHAGSRSADMAYSLELEGNAQQHRRLAAEWDQLIDQAREVPGFQDIMRPRKFNELIRAARDGPVVVINVHSSRCDALIIRSASESISHVALEKFTSEKAVGARALMVSLVGQREGRVGGFKRKVPVLVLEETFKEVLAMLWSDVVKPVLDFLGYTRRLPIEELPRITWCTTGALSFLPLHAAGYYDGSQPNAFDVVISSYTPTLSALLPPATLTSSSQVGVLAVGQEHVSGLEDLPGTVRELAEIKEHAERVGYLQLDGQNATVGEVLKGMEQHSWVHLACHAIQNIGDPVQSGFHLCDGTLALSTIMKRSFKNKGLAFLSACQTATGDERLPDEAVHLAAGMLMAGYPSVIATMWGIDDEDAPEVARHVYSVLLKGGEMNRLDAARALHGAVAGLREKIGQNSFKRWVPFIHIGL